MDIKKTSWKLRKLMCAREEGSAIIELGISMPLLMLMLLGMGELARVAYAAIEVSSAAHSAAQFASWKSAAASNAGGISNAATANSDLPISVSSVAVSCVCANGATPSSCSDNTTCTNANTAMIETVTVQTRVSFSPLIHYPGGPTTYTLRGSDTQTVSNQ